MDLSIYQPIIDHFGEHWLLYVIGAAVLLPPMIIWQKYVTPVIFWAVEVLIYTTILHIMTHYVTSFVSWFTNESSSEALAGGASVQYETPLLEFWDMSAYSPVGILYFELAMMGVFTYLVLKFRPFKVQRSTKDTYGKATPEQRRQQMRERMAAKRGAHR